jgi:hypothetical protein
MTPPTHTNRATLESPPTSLAKQQPVNPSIQTSRSELVFEPPTESCHFLVLELPASAVGGKGMFRLKIPRSMWSREAKAEKPTPQPGQPEPGQAQSGQPQPVVQVPEFPQPTTPETPSARNMRTWHAKTGTYTIEAEYLWHTPEKVCLRRADGEEIKVSLDKLSDEDVAWIKQQGK